MQNRHVALASLIACLACSDPTGPDAPQRVALIELSTPASIPTGAALDLTLRYSIPACWKVSAVRVDARGAAVDIEILGRAGALPQGTACLTVMIDRDTTIALNDLPNGDVTVRGLQPDGQPILRMVRVGP
jgi:hypothetical protein